MNAWKTCRLTKLINVQNGYAFKSDQLKGKGIPVIKIKNIQPPNISITEADCYSGEPLPNLNQFVIKKKDILISMTGSHVSQISSAVGKVGRYNFDQPSLLNQRVGKVYSLDKRILNDDFLYYLISRPEIQFELATNAGGSANQANISPQDIKNLEIDLPDIETQRRIAEILSALDDKIELNRRMNQTLEQIAQTLFKHYFVDGINEDNLPEGWKSGMLCDVSKNLRKSINPKELEEERKYVGLEHVPRKSIALYEWGSSEGLESNKYEFEENNILFGKLRPYFHKVILTPFNGICSTDILVIKPKEELYQFFGLLHFASDEVVQFSNMYSSGTRMPRTDWKSLSKYEIAIPPSDILREFNELVLPIVEKIKGNIREITTLTKTRDTLLPKLMSGEIDVMQAQKDYEQVLS